MLGFKIAYIILFVVMTLFTVTIHPIMHKSLSIENVNFNIEEVRKADRETQVNNIQTVVNEIEQPKIVNTISTTQRNTFSDDSSNYRQKNVTVNPQSDKNIDKNWVFKNLDSSQNKTVSLNTQTRQQTVAKPIADYNNQTNKVQRVQKPSANYSQEEVDLKNFERIMNESTKNPNKDLSADEIKTVFNVLTSNSKPKINNNVNRPMTEQEEIIAWNRWRATLQNRVMRDSNVVAPIGTVFMFSCVVDKYGNISNINAWSTNPNYVAMAKRSVKPALAALQGQSILKFPQGTRRNSTVVAGSFIISTSERYASPNDYSDFERVK